MHPDRLTVSELGLEMPPEPPSESGLEGRGEPDTDYFHGPANAEILRLRRETAVLRARVAYLEGQLRGARERSGCSPGGIRIRRW